MFDYVIARRSLQPFDSMKKGKIRNELLFSQNLVQIMYNATLVYYDTGSGMQKETITNYHISR